MRVGKREDPFAQKGIAGGQILKCTSAGCGVVTLLLSFEAYGQANSRRKGLVRRRSAGRVLAPLGPRLRSLAERWHGLPLAFSVNGGQEPFDLAMLVGFQVLL